MQKAIKISILMGVYNPAEGPNFWNAVDSILNQSFQDWELIICDDGSDAESARRIEQVVQRDGRIRLIKNSKNRGLGHALNQCLKCAEGAYIGRMDADDLSKPDRLSIQYAFLEKHPKFQWVGSNAELFDKNGVWGMQKMPEIPQKKDFLFNSPYIHPSVMFRRDFLVSNGGYEESKGILQCEDYELFMRLHQRGGRGYNIQEPLLMYWEDYESQKKRTFSRRLRELRVRRRGYEELGILNSRTFFYVLKPLLAGAVPAPVHHYIRRRIK